MEILRNCLSCTPAAQPVAIPHPVEFADATMAWYFYLATHFIDEIRAGNTGHPSPVRVADPMSMVSGALIRALHSVGACWNFTSTSEKNK
jgi:hypothetical protein